MAVNPNNLLGQSNPNGTVGVSLGIDPAGANEAFSAGATSGFYVTPTSPAGMSVEVGGAVGVVDSALVRSASGITFPVGNTSGTPITLTVPAAPSTNSRIDSVVLYVDTSATATLTDGADAVGIEIVSGTSASSPVPPTDQQIRSAIQDGASIAYTVLANITVSSSTSTITASNISQANRAQLAADKIDFTTTPFVRIGLASGTTIPTGSYAQLRIDSEFNNNFCHVNGTQVVFDKIGTFIGTATVGRSTRPGTNTRINGGLRRNGTNNNLIPFTSPILSGDSPFVHGAGLFNIQSGDYGQVFLSNDSLGNCDTLSVSISPLL